MHRSTDSQVLRSRDVIPTPRIGILGGGQLAKMTAMAATQFGCEIVVLERQEDFPAHSLDTHALIGDWHDTNLLLKLGSLVDIVTLENEFVSPQALDILARNGHVLYPTTETIVLIQDKYEQKRALANAGLPVARFGDASAKEAIQKFGYPAVIKKRLNGYDGKGNAEISSAAELDDAWKKLDGDQNRLFIEEFCRFSKELAIIVARSRDGSIVAYPVVETVNKDHICHRVKAPASVSVATAEIVKNIAVKTVETIGGVGSFGIEFFYLEEGNILINEIAPRVHNTGHYTIEACVCSQFENHVRAILGWPLGSAEMITPAACMVNLLGYADGNGVPKGLKEALEVPGAHVHIYGKTRSARGRKMGHITVFGNDIDEVTARAQHAADCIQFGGKE